MELKKIFKTDIVLPIFLVSAFLVLLIFNSLRLNFSFSDINGTQSYNIIFSIVAALPIMFLFFTKYFWQVPWHRKILLTGLTMFVLSCCYSANYTANNSYVFFGCALSFFIFERKFYKPTVIHILFALYCFWNIFSICWANDFFTAKSAITKYLPFIMVPLAFCFFKLEKKEINLILMIFFRVVLIWLVMSLCCWVLESRYLEIPLSEWFSTSKHVLRQRSPYNIVYAWTCYRQPTFNAIFYLTAMIFGLHFWKKRAQIRPNIFELILFTVATFVIIITTQSRVGFVLFALILVVFYLSFFVENKKMLIINFSLLTICGIIFTIFFHQKLYEVFSDSTRQQIYKTAFFYIKNNVLTGCGLGSMSDIFRSVEIANMSGYEVPFLATHAHNQFIGDFMQTGIIGFLLIVSILICLVYFSFKNKNWLLLSFFVLYLIFMLIEMPLYFKNSGIIFVLFALLFKNFEINPNINEKNLCNNNVSQ